jgi:hypothetical protein
MNSIIDKASSYIPQILIEKNSDRKWVNFIYDIKFLYSVLPKP